MTQDSSDLSFLQGLTEEEFSELVLIPLLSAMGYSEIRYIHGRRELGKDIVFTRHDPIDRDVTMCAVVKMRPLSGSVSSNRGVREIFFQVSQALQEPFIHPRTGDAVTIEKAYVVTPYPASIDAVASIRGEIKGFENRVSIIDGPAIVDHIKNFLPNLLISIQTAERRFVQSLLLKLTSSRTSRPLSPTIAVTLLEVYTAGTLSPTTREAASLASFARPLDLDEDVEIDDILQKHPFVVVTADVGAGKTSLLQMLAIRVLRRASESATDSLLPLFVPLHRLPLQAFQSMDLLPAIKDYLLAEGLPSPDWRDTSRYLLLLDGFDEIPDLEFSGKELNRLCQVFPRIVITSRPSRLPNVSEDFVFYHLKPFDQEDIQVFLRKWFGGDHETPKKIHAKIVKDPVLRIFCRTPLMLTLFAILAERLPVDQLPTRRTGVYSEISDLLLGRWDEVRGVQNIYSADLKAFTLERIALLLQERGERRFPELLLYSEAASVRESAAARGVGGSNWAFGRELIFRSSLLRPSGSGHLEFVHLSFQEYFAARKIARSSNRDLMLRALFDEWWRGTWTFFFGISRTLDDLNLARKSNIRRAQALGAYLAEADYTSPEKRREVLKLIGTEVLHQPRLDESLSIYYTAYGYEIIEEMTAEVSRQNFRGNTFNYAFLAVMVQDSRAHQTLLHEREVLRRLTGSDICKLLECLSVQLESDTATELFERLCQRIPGLVQHTTSEDRTSLWEALKAVSLSIRTAQQQLRMHHGDHILKAQNAVYNAAKATLPDWKAVFDEKNLSHWGSAR